MAAKRGFTDVIHGFISRKCSQRRRRQRKKGGPGIGKVRKERRKRIARREKVSDETGPRVLLD